jgi:calcium-dependent protein kinase
MGNICDKICPFWKKRNEVKDLYCPLTQELGDYEYKSKNSSYDMSNLNNLDELKIKSSAFITEKSGLPMDNYYKLADIGEGAYGHVMKVGSRTINEIRAMKVIKKSSIISYVKEERLFNEINILKRVDHPNIIKIYEFFKDGVNYYIITEFCEEGDLYDKLISMPKSHFSEKLVCFIMKQMFSAVAYLHSKDIIHGDLKLENILIDSSPYKKLDLDYFDVKLIDFGCSRFFKGNQTGISGTSMYYSPEIINNQYDEMSDLWACGVIMYLLLCGEPPFKDEEKGEEELFENIKKGNYDLSNPAFKTVSQNAKDLIRDLLNLNPKQRPPARKVLTHLWFKQREEIALVDINYSKTVLKNLKEFNSRTKFQQAVITYITHNLIERDEISKLRTIFKLMDVDNDGRISQIELKNGLKSVLGTVSADIEVQQIMKAIDMDCNGYIEYEEFLRATLDSKILLSENNLRMAFNTFDVKKEGSITSEDIRFILGGGKEIPDNIMSGVLAEIDKKIDDTITYQDFSEIMNKIFNY